MQSVLYTPCAKTKEKLMDFVAQVGLKSNYLFNKINIRPRIKSLNLHSMHCDFSSFNFFASFFYQKIHWKSLSFEMDGFFFLPLLHYLDKPNNWASWRCIRIVLAWRKLRSASWFVYSSQIFNRTFFLTCSSVD